MPRYFFHLLSDGERVPDDEGLELEDNQVARREALESLRDLIADAVSGDLKPLRVGIEIVREGQGVIDRLTGQIAIAPEA